jgi:hypothetical protein
MITTAQWKDVFRQLDQWDALPKLREIHRGANSGMTATWLARLFSPNVAYLVVDTAGEIQLFHHFHHDVDDGLNYGTNQLWALQAGSSMAQAVSIRPDHLSLKQKGYEIEWTTMTAWNSTADILADVDLRVNEHAPQAARVERPPMTGRSAKALASKTKTKRQVPIARGRKRQVEPTDSAPKATQDYVEDVEIVESQLATMVPILAFVAATPFVAAPSWKGTNRTPSSCVGKRSRRYANVLPRTKMQWTPYVWERWRCMSLGGFIAPP